MSRSGYPATAIAALVAEVSIRHISGRSLSQEHCAALHEYEKDGGDIVSLIGTIGMGKLLAEYHKEHPQVASSGSSVFEARYRLNDASNTILIADLARVEFVLFGVPVTPDEAVGMSESRYHRSEGYRGGKRAKLEAFREACKHPYVKGVLEVDPDYFVRLDRLILKLLNESRRNKITQRL